MQKILKATIAAIKGSEKEFTTGSINRAIFMLSIPMILEMVMESLFAVVDVYFVNQISVEAVATVGLTESVITIVYAIAFGISMAASAMVARRIGEGKPEAAAIAAAQTIILGLIIAVLLGILGIIYADDVLRMMGGDDKLIAVGAGYARVMFGTNFVILLLFLLNGIFRGAGDASLAMRSLWIANGLNIILDPLFIFGIGPFPELGVQGAAVATVIGRSSGILFQLWILYRNRSIIKMKMAHFIPQWPILKRLLEISAGGAGQHVIASASWIFMMRFVSEFGSTVLAGYTTAIRVAIFTLLPSWGLAMAGATLVGQNLGANKPGRAETSVWRTAFYNMAFLLIVSIIFIILAEPVMQIFTDDKAVIAAGTIALKILCISYAFHAYGMVIGQAFNGAGDTKTPTWANFIAMWIVAIPLAWVLAFKFEMGPNGVYWSVIISETLLAIILILAFRKGKWKLVEV